METFTTPIALQHRPGWPLSDFVELIWFYHGHEVDHGYDRILPDGSMSIIINLAEDEMRVYDRDDLTKVERTNGIGITGAHTGFFLIDTAEQFSTMGILFKPGGSMPFLRMPATEVMAQHVPLDAVWGSEAPWLRERLLAARTPAEKVALVEDALLTRLTGDDEIHPAVSLAIDAFSRVPQIDTVSSVVARSGYSQRRFTQLFSEAVGLTPKMFCRIRRFQYVLANIHHAHEIDWTAVALGGGYYDQAHFIRDFQAFSGINPTAYVALRTDHRNHVPIRD